MGILGALWMSISAGFSLTNPLLIAGFMQKVIPGIGDAVDEAAKEIIELADQEVKGRLYPGHGYLTGQLHDSYKGEYSKSGSSVVNIEYGTDVEYAPFVEFRWEGRVAHFYPGMAEVERRAGDILASKINGKLGIK